MAIEINFIVGGEAGQGVQSVGFLLAKALARGDTTFLQTKIMNRGFGEDIIFSASAAAIHWWKRSVRRWIS